METPPTFTLTYEVLSSGDVTIIALNGRLDAARLPIVENTLVDVGNIEGVQVVLDLAQLSWIDSPGVGQIVKLVKRARKTGGEVAIAQLTGQPKEIFQLLRLDSAIRCFDNTAEAISGLVGC